MAVIIPDLFGAFQKGREYAIDRNWKDLENYETIEKMRTANDMAQLALLQERYYTPLKMSMFADNADNSAMQNQIQFTAFPGALSRARQYTNQAVSDEAVQANTLGDTAQTTIATTLAENERKRGEAQQTSSYSRNTEWGKNGAIAAAMTNYKAGKALDNAQWEQLLFELRAEAEKGTLGQTIFMNGVNASNRPLIKQLQTQVLNNDFASAKKTFEQIMSGEQGTVNNSQAIKYVNPSFQYDTDIALIEKMNEIDNIIARQPNLADDIKANYQQIRETYSKELADRGVSPRNVNTNNQPLIPRRPTTNTPGRGVLRQNVNDAYNLYNIGGYFGLNPPPQQGANQAQDLSGGGQSTQPTQTTYQSPADADLAAFENNLLTKSKFGTEQKNRIKGAISLQRNSSLFNVWGGIVGENDQYRGSVLVNGRPIPYSTNTAVNLTALGNDLTPLQRGLKQSLLLSGEFPVKPGVDGKLEFDLDKLFPRIENNQVLTKPLINRGDNYGQSSTNPKYK